MFVDESVMFFILCREMDRLTDDSLDSGAINTIVYFIIFYCISAPYLLIYFYILLNQTQGLVTIDSVGLILFMRLLVSILLILLFIPNAVIY